MKGLEMKKIAAPLVFILILSLLPTGAHASPWELITDFFGPSVSKLERIKDKGAVRTYSIPYDEAFDKVLALIKEYKLTAWGKNRKKGYIVVIDVPKQVDTTQVGIFFESTEQGGTKITISSLSSTALNRVSSMIFGGLETTPATVTTPGKQR